jgi:acetyl-CoA carboxylase biotin carboxyl carrier protein
MVRRGQQVAIVEAMKLMLPVEADLAGMVIEVLVQDGQPVEYGERLMTLAPADAA